MIRTRTPSVTREGLLGAPLVRHDRPAVAAPAETMLPHQNLDTLRALAVSCVFLAHLGGSLTEVRPWMTSLGQSGVMLFFVHTACVLMPSLERILPKATSWRNAVVSFWTRRVWRLYPPAQAVIVALLVLMIGFGLPIIDGLPVLRTDPWSVRGIMTIVGNLLLMQNIFGVDNIEYVMWTLTLEIQMYLVLPWCFRLVEKRGVGGVVFALVAASVISVLLRMPQPGARLSIVGYVPCFLCGVLAYAIIKRYGPTAQKVAWHWWLPALVALLLIQIFVIVTPNRPMCIVVGVMIPLFGNAPRTKRVTKIAEVVARYSYSIYLTHRIALALAFQWINVAYGLRVPTFLVCAAMFAYVSYHLFEVPSQQMGHRIAERQLTR